MTGTVQALEFEVGVASNGWKPYPAYKDSGVPWMGSVPEGWEVLRIKTVLQECDVRPRDESIPLFSLTRSRGLIPYSERTNRVHSAKSLVGYKFYRSGQIVMNRMQAWSGMFGASSIDGLVSPDYAVFEVLGDHRTELLLDRLKAPDLVGQFALESKGIGSGFNRLYGDRFGAIPISLPHPSEQDAIVRVLDYHDRLIRKSIRAKQKLIGLLTEQKQAIIQHSVTRGLNPDVKLKPSGVDWLGEIPRHWSVSRLKHLVFNVNNQVAAKEPDEAYVPMESVRSWTGKITPQVSGVSFDSTVKRFLPDDVLFGKLRPYLAKVARPQIKGVWTNPPQQQSRLFRTQ
jgi:type I restriction enzyme, S subunit